MLTVSPLAVPLFFPGPAADLVAVRHAALFAVRLRRTSSCTQQSHPPASDRRVVHPGRSRVTDAADSPPLPPTPPPTSSAPARTTWTARATPTSPPHSQPSALLPGSARGCPWRSSAGLGACASIGLPARRMRCLGCGGVGTWAVVVLVNARPSVCDGAALTAAAHCVRPTWRGSRWGRAAPSPPAARCTAAA